MKPDASPAVAIGFDSRLSRSDSSPDAFAAGPAQTFIYFALVAAHVALVWLLPYFPSNDGPNHVYNLVVLRDLLHGTGGWEPYYALTLHVAPNLGFTLFAYPWLAILPPVAVERVFLTIYVLLFAASVPLWLRAFRRAAFPLSYFAFVALFSMPVMMGFYSEIIGTPLLLLAVALAWKMRESRTWLRVLAMNLAGLALFVVHLIPFAIYLLAVTLAAFAEERPWRAGMRRAAVQLIALLPCILPAALFYFAHHAPAPVHWSIQPGNQLRDLLSFGEYSYSYWQLVPGLAACALVLLALPRAFRERSARSESEGNAESAACRFLAVLSLVLVFAFLYAPDTLAGGAELQRRLPPLILLFGLPLLTPGTPRIRPRRYAQVAAAVAVLALAVNAGVFWQQSRRVAQFVRGTAAPLPPHALLISLQLDDRKHAFPDPLFHAGSYYGLAGAVDLGQYLTTHMSDAYFQLHFREPVSEQAVTDVFNGKVRPASAVPQVQFALCWSPGDACRENLSPDFSPFWSEDGNPLSIWKR